MKSKTIKLGMTGLVITLTLSIAPIASAQGIPHNSAEADSSADRQFQECASGNYEPPNALTIGGGLGSGITEPLTDELRTILTNNGRTVPSSAVAIRHLDTGESVFVDEDGNNVGSLSNQGDKKPTVQTFGIIPDEAKRIIGACLGVSWESGPLAEAIFREVTTVKTAVKFVIRRIGLGAAIGCVGGIIWEYI